MNKRHQEIAQQVVECWLEDCEALSVLDTKQMELLLHHIEVGLMRGEEMNETKTIVDIVDRLRLMNQPEADEAATEIERLREANELQFTLRTMEGAEITRLRGALASVRLEARFAMNSSQYLQRIITISDAILHPSAEVSDDFKKLAHETVKDSREILDVLEKDWDDGDEAAELREIITEALAVFEEDVGSLEVDYMARGCKILAAALIPKEKK